MRPSRGGGIVSASFLAILCAAHPAFAAGSAKFAVTIEKVELKNAQSEWITIIRPDRLVDLINEEPVVSFFNNDGRIPAGRYVNFRVTLSETVRIAGRIKGANCTRADGAAVLGGTAARVSDLPGEITSFKETSPTWREGGPEDVGDVSLKLNLDHEDEDDVMTISCRADFETPVEVKKGDFIKVWFDVTAADAVRDALPGAFGPGVPARHAMYALPPPVEELVLTVGETDHAVTGRDVVFDF
ncbi:MAG TPA: hypothetical protein VL404_08900 [Candidatus Eisenbacteria bacterium]|nr:hypothetical protein [Candidatus Eisenbacteria bacterium]